jgi:S1-C subfamily serine protease
MMKMLILLLSLQTIDAALTDRSVVQVLTYSQAPVWNSPWRFQSVQHGTGTGFLIKGDYIMTNAHVVSWGRQILIRKPKDPRPYPAEVVHIAHDCDLALLRVNNPQFLDGMEPLEFGPLPEVRSTVVTYGYPAGGNRISFTRGVVSRIEMQNYVHIGNRSFLSVQTDAAINPGNSGGPVIQDDRVVGVAFMGTPGLENTGFFIPFPVIDHFLKDIQDGVYDGFPMAGIRLVPLQNPAFRNFLNLPDNGRGARIDSVLFRSGYESLFRKDDVIMRVGDYDVESDGTVSYQGNRVFVTVALLSSQSGDLLDIEIWRNAQSETLQVPMEIYDNDRYLSNQYDVPHRYYVFAGLVFSPLSLDYLKTFGRNWRNSANSELVFELFYRRKETPKKAKNEPIVLISTLSHPVNADMQITSGALIDKVNGQSISKLEDLIRAFESNESDFHQIDFLPDHSFECLRRTEAEQAHQEILNTYGIPSDRRL